MMKVATATTIGTTIEYYVFVYGAAAALVSPVVFFPALARRSALVATLFIGATTIAIGLLPTPKMLCTFGWLAPTLLVAMRFLQGFAVGGE